MDKLKRILLLALCASLVPLTALSAEEEKKVSEAQVMAVKALYTAATLREIGCKNTADAVKALFSPRAEIRWKRLAAEYAEEQLNDFFLGATILGDKNLNYSALYNPFWDTILLLNSTGLPDVPKVESFAFISGCKFRGEPYAENPADVEGTVPKANPYAVDLWNVTLRTTKHYKSVFDPKASTEMTRLMLNDAKDTERIQIRSAIRLKLFSMFLKNKAMEREAHRMSLYLTGGHEEKMMKYFKDGGASFVALFAKLDPRLREHFIPYCYFPGKEATLFVFFNRAMPRIIVTVTYPRKGISRIMEWYDLNASEEYMAIWNKNKEEKK